jgi:hypothetical protein
LRTFEVLNLGRYERQAYLGIKSFCPRHLGPEPESKNFAVDLDFRVRGNDGVVLTREERRERLLKQKEHESFAI